MRIPDSRGKLSPNTHFVVKVRGDSMDGGNTPIRDGDWVLLERLGAQHAGSLTAERAVAVEFRDETGDTAYALKQVRKDRDGVYWLHSWNSAYEDVRVDPNAFFPWARLIRRVDNAEM